MKRGSQLDEIRYRAENDLEFFIRLVHPQRMLGVAHTELIKWWSRTDAKSHQLVLLPRDHQKSALMAYRVAHAIVRDPCIRILYISSTSNLAVKQLGFIKDIITCKKFRQYWPDMVNLEEGRRKKWTESEISVDHPSRELEVVRDPTIFTGGLTTNVVGMHCDILVLDDLVTDETAYTSEGRERVKRAYSLLSSVEGGESFQWVTGTRYDPNDLYNDMLTMQMNSYDEKGNELEPVSIYEIFERQVEDVGDGSGEFLWPRQRRDDGKWFGFDRNILERKRAQYQDNPTQFYAQYYNNPNDKSTASISADYFQYYERSNLVQSDGRWYIKGRKLNIFAAIDFAYSLSKKSDYTSIVVIGCDKDRNFYILDIDRFKTLDISEYYKHILLLHTKWDFRKLRAEVTVAQSVIVEALKNDYVRRDGLSLVVEDYRPQARDGVKAERIEHVLQPKYSNRQVWHYKGGNCQLLEEELVLQRPPHDDIKDALSSVIPMCIPPTGSSFQRTNQQMTHHPRFGGVV